MAAASGRRTRGRLDVVRALRGMDRSPRLSGGWRGECGYVGVDIEHGAERVPQRREPGFEMAPVVDAVAVDRTTDLLGTGGAHRAFVLEEAQARILERQPAMVEQAAHLGLG